MICLKPFQFLFVLFLLNLIDRKFVVSAPRCCKDCSDASSSSTSEEECCNEAEEGVEVPTSTTNIPMETTAFNGPTKAPHCQVNFVCVDCQDPRYCPQNGTYECCCNKMGGKIPPPLYIYGDYSCDPITRVCKGSVPNYKFDISTGLCEDPQQCNGKWARIDKPSPGLCAGRSTTSNP